MSTNKCCVVVRLDSQFPTKDFASSHYSLFICERSGDASLLLMRCIWKSIKKKSNRLKSSITFGYDICKSRCCSFDVLIFSTSNYHGSSYGNLEIDWELLVRCAFSSINSFFILWIPPKVISATSVLWKDILPFPQFISLHWVSWKFVLLGRRPLPVSKIILRV